MRTYARARNADGSKTWLTIETAANGDNSLVYLVTLCQVLLLNLNESPWFGNFGLPSQQSVMQQVAPDYYISRTQQQFAPYFASLLIARAGNNPPTYNIAVTTLAGAQLNFDLPLTASPPNQIPQ